MLKDLVQERKVNNYSLSKRLTYTAVFVVLGVLFPQIFHLFGTSGTMFLPMHIPVLIAGFLLGGVSGLTVGILSSVLSCFLFGMPTMLKMPFMVFELATYGFVSGVVFKKTKYIYFSLICSMIAGRVIYFLSITFASYVLKINLPQSFSILATLSSGVVGIIIQLVFVPMLVKISARYLMNSQNDFAYSMKQGKKYNNLLKKYSCIIEKDEKAVSFEEKGVKPLLMYLQENSFEGCYIADRIVGKAAALLMVYGKVKFVYTLVISKHAQKVFEENEISYKANKVVDFIENRDKTDMCPMEKLCLNIDEPQVAYFKLKEKINI